VGHADRAEQRFEVGGIERAVDQLQEPAAVIDVAVARKHEVEVDRVPRALGSGGACSDRAYGVSDVAARRRPRARDQRREQPRCVAVELGEQGDVVGGRERGE